MTFLQWFETIAFALNDSEPDHEFARYPLEQMVAAYNAGLCLVEKYRPDLFTEWRIVKLDEGSYQDVRGCCANVLEVVSQTDEHGNTIKEIHGSRDTTTTTKKMWKKPSCIQFHGDYLVENASIDQNMNGRFTVDPPVPCDTDAYVRVKCVSGACRLTVDGLNSMHTVECAMMSALWYFVLARMQAGDRFTEVPYDNMRYNHKMFFDILGIVEAKERAIESPEEA